MLPACSRCLSAAGIRFSAILSRLVFRPSRDRPTAGRPPAAPRTMTGFPRSAHMRHDRIGRPLYPGTSGARTGHQLPWPAACRLSTARVLSPGAAVIYPGFDLTRRQRGFKRFARPAFPSPAAPG
jgi:hypothetical protein